MKPRSINRVCAIAAVLALCPTAHAHLVNTGLGPIYDGGVHLALSPDDLLGLLAAALLAGLRGPRASRMTLVVLPLSWLIGGLIGLNAPGIPASQGLSILSFCALGVLVALDIKLPALGVAALACVLGLIHGVLNGAALEQANKGTHTLLGIVLTVFVVSLLVSSVVVAMRPDWTRIAVRVGGSWVAASGLLMLGWLYKGAF